MFWGDIGGVDAINPHPHLSYIQKPPTIWVKFSCVFLGMDRELAEEFIEQTMDPGGGGGVDQSQTMSGTESEAW